MYPFKKFQLYFVSVLMIVVSACSGPSAYSNKSQASDDPAIRELEQQIRHVLDTVESDTDFTLLIKAENGRTFTHSVGDSSPTKNYRSASTSKMVTAAIILSIVNKGILDLDDHPQQYITNWPTTGNLSEIKLRHLLSFTSGLTEEPACINNPLRSITSCVNNIVRANKQTFKPGTVYHYNSSHLQVAGMMAMQASGANDWETIFTQFQSATSLFPSAAYDLPSKRNPRLAGGMHWTAVDYLDFLEALYLKKILSPKLITAMTSDQLVNVRIEKTPAVAINEDWHYGFGTWIECHQVVFNCSGTTKVSSPGAYGAYPFIDYQHQYYGILAREGRLGTFAKGYTVFTAVEELLQQWAALNRR